MGNPFMRSKFEILLFTVASIFPYKIGEKIITIGWYLKKYWLPVTTFLITAVVTTMLFLTFK